MQRDATTESQADTAADQGSIDEQPKLYQLAKYIVKGKKRYNAFMARVHKYILKLKEADKIKREESDNAKAANPF